MIDLTVMLDLDHGQFDKSEALRKFSRKGDLEDRTERTWCGGPVGIRTASRGSSEPVPAQALREIAGLVVAGDIRLDDRVGIYGRLGIDPSEYARFVMEILSVRTSGNGTCEPSII